MSLYPLDKLMSATSEELELWSKERINIFVMMLNNLLKNKEVKAFYNNEVLLTVDKIEYGTQVDSGFMINAGEYQFFPLNIYFKQYNKQFKRKYKSLYQDGRLLSSLFHLIQDSMDRETGEKNKAQSFFGYKNHQGENFIQLDVYYPCKWFAPDFKAAYLLKNKLDVLKEKDILEELEQSIKEMSLKRFNVMNENHNYVTEDLTHVFEMIDVANKKFDKDTVSEIVKKYPNNKEVLIKCMHYFNHDVFEFSSEALKNDREFIYEQAIQQRKVHMLEFAAEHIKNEFILEAIKINGYALNYASEELRSNKEVCLLALKTNSFCISCMSEELKEDIDVLTSVAQSYPLLLIGKEELKTNKELLLLSLTHIHKEASHDFLIHTTDILKDDNDVALAALIKDENNLQYLSPRLQEELKGKNAIDYLQKIVLSKSNKVKNKP